MKREESPKPESLRPEALRPESLRPEALKAEWTQPLIRILEGHEELFKETSEFPKIGKLPGLEDWKEIDSNLTHGFPGTTSASPAVAIVVVVVCVAVAARPGVVTSEELLRAKLLDVYSPKERLALREAIDVVKKNPSLIKSALGIEQKVLGVDFAKNLDRVQNALSIG